MSDQEQGFTVKDRRQFNEDGTPREPEPPAESPAPEEPPAQAEPQAQSEPQEPPRHHLPPVDFSALILSLSHAAMMHLGHIPDHLTGETKTDLELARHTIDTIAMLKEKTTGNLTQDEQRLTENVLTELRLDFVRQSA